VEYQLLEYKQALPLVYVETQSLADVVADVVEDTQ